MNSQSKQNRRCLMALRGLDRPDWLFIDRGLSALSSERRREARSRRRHDSEDPLTLSHLPTDYR